MRTEGQDQAGSERQLAPKGSWLRKVFGSTRLQLPEQWMLQRGGP